MAAAAATATTRLCVWISVSGPVLAETLARECASAADCLLIDNQHGAFGTDAALQVLAAITGKVKHVAVRISEVGDAETCKFLDAGASVVVAPMINTRTDAERFVRACLYPPAGVRSFGPYRQKSLIKGGFSLKAANEACEPLAMIETTQALANLDDILSVPGLAGVFVGPNDLAISMGFQPSSAPQEQPKVFEAVKTIAAKTRAKGLIAGIFCVDPITARKMQEIGFNFVSVGTDSGFASEAAKNALRASRL